jgi:hypothetical protein
MGHISELALLDHLSGSVELTTQEHEHLEDCADCRELAIEVRRMIADSGGAGNARRILGEEGTLPSANEPPTDHEEQRELNERPGRKRA